MTYLASLDAARQARFRQRRKERLELAGKVAWSLACVLDYPESLEVREWARKVLEEWRGGNLSQPQTVARAERQQPLDQHDDQND